MFRLNKVIIFIIILFSFINNVNALVEPTSEFYVNDYANILSEETEKYIIEKSKILDNTDGTQIVVVTVNNLEGMYIENYSLQLARKLGIGDGEKDNGLLLLLALEEREFRVEVGYGLEGILPDAKTGRFQDNYIIPYLKDDKWDEGIKNGYDAFYSEIVKLNNLSLNYNDPISNNSFIENFQNSETFVYLFMAFGYGVGIIIGNYKKQINKHNKRKKIKENIKKDYSNVLILIYVLLIFFLKIIYSIFIKLCFFNIMFFLIGIVVSKANNSGSTGSRYSGYSSRGSSFGGRSSSSHGGGGSFGGGGSSRKF